VRTFFTATLLASIVAIYWLDLRVTGGRLSAALLGLLALAGVHELIVMFRRAGFAISRGLLLSITALLCSSAFAFAWRSVDRELYPLVIATMLILYPLAVRSLLQERMARGLEEQGATLLAFIFVAWPMYLAQGLVLRHLPSALFVVLVCKGGDIGGYLVGSFLGRRKLIPHISKGKTVEGALGSLVFSCVVSIALWRPVVGEVLDLGLTGALLIGIMLNLTTQTGDLVESLIKRRCGVKDSAALLPAHGGVLDLVDSLLFSFPAYFMVLTILT
jgi:CDP-diglyceride synthetase